MGYLYEARRGRLKVTVTIYINESYPEVGGVTDRAGVVIYGENVFITDEPSNVRVYI